MLTIVAVLLATALSTTAQAQDGNKEQARTLFNAGVQAYKQGQFMHAAQAFTKAHALLPKPPLLFSIAQAFRREFDDKQQKPALVMAVKYYRKYLDAVTEGGRRLEATKALGDLKPYLQGLGGDSAVEMTFPTRLSVNSPTPGAMVSLDGGKLEEIPYNRQIAPGKHTIVVKASGYEAQERTFDARQGDILPFDMPLAGTPPTFQVHGADGAEVTIDGKVLGRAPFTQPLALDAGRHFVTVTERGHKAYAEELEFDFGSKTSLEVDLPATNQRRWAWGVLAGGGTTLAAAGVLAGFAFMQENEAKDIEATQSQGVISEQQRMQHNSAIRTRDDLILATALSAGVGAAVSLTGLFLYLFDEPVVTPPLRGTDEADEAPSDEPSQEIKILGAPMIGPGTYGVGLTGRF